MQNKRELKDLRSIGKAMLKDFELMGITSVSQLAKRNPEKMYEELCRKTNTSQDICVLDVFFAAVAQARNPRLPEAQKDWWYWSRKRKARAAAGH